MSTHSLLGKKRKEKKKQTNNQTKSEKGFLPLTYFDTTTLRINQHTVFHKSKHGNALFMLFNLTLSILSAKNITDKEPV